MQQIKTALAAAVALSFLPWQIAAAETAESGELQEIVVTARKREESAQSVPLAINVQSAETLQQHQITDLYGLANLTPSLQVQAATAQVGATRFSIRGVGTSVLGPQIENSVGVVVDDVALARGPLFAPGGIFDLERIEVLNGPQGMLFGKNAAAGLINIVTRSPQLNTTETFANVQYGNQTSGSAGNDEQIQAGANLPVGGQAAVRVTGYFDNNDGYTKDLYRHQSLGHQEEGIRAQLRFAPSDSLDFLLSGDYTKGNGPGESVYTHRFEHPGAVAAANDAAHGITASPDNAYMASAFPWTFDDNIYGTSLKSTVSLGDFSLVNVTAYRRALTSAAEDSDDTPADTLSFEQQHDFQQVSTEFRLVSPQAGRFTYQAGLYYLDLHAREQDFFDGNFTFIPGLGYPPFPFPTENNIALVLKNQNAAGFIEGGLKLTDALTLTSGARYTHDYMQYAVDFTTPPGFFSQIPGVDTIHAHNSVSKHNLSFRFILDYQVTPDVMPYASYSRGYKGPTFDQFTANIVNAEIPTDIEIGVKSTLYERRLRLDLSLFDEKFSGFQTQAQDVAHNTFLTVNAGQLRSRGVELQTAAVPFKSLTLSGGMTYNTTKYEGVPPLPCYYGEPVGTSGNNVCIGPLGSQTTTVNGNQLAQAPKWTETVTVRYEQPLLTGWHGFMQGDGYFRSSYNFTPYQDLYTRIGSTAIFGLSAGAAADDRHLILTLFVRNLTDKRVPAFIVQDPTSLLNGDAFVGTGGYVQLFNSESFRTIGVSLSYRR